MCGPPSLQFFDRRWELPVNSPSLPWSLFRTGMCAGYDVHALSNLLLVCALAWCARFRFALFMGIFLYCWLIIFLFFSMYSCTAHRIQTVYSWLYFTNLVNFRLASLPCLSLASCWYALLLLISRINSVSLLLPHGLHMANRDCPRALYLALFSGQSACCSGAPALVWDDLSGWDEMVVVCGAW
jgi:hypothetical protein